MEIDMKPTQELMAEHNAVLVALQLLEKVEAAFAAKIQQSPESATAWARASTRPITRCCTP